MRQKTWYLTTYSLTSKKPLRYITKKNCVRSKARCDSLFIEQLNTKMPITKDIPHRRYETYFPKKIHKVVQ